MNPPQQSRTFDAVRTYLQSWRRWCRARIHNWLWPCMGSPKPCRLWQWPQQIPNTVHTWRTFLLTAGIGPWSPWSLSRQMGTCRPRTAHPICPPKDLHHPLSWSAREQLQNPFHFYWTNGVTSAEMARVTRTGLPRSPWASPDFSIRSMAAGRTMSSNCPKTQCFPVGFLKVPHHIFPVSLSTYSFRSSSFSM